MVLDTSAIVAVLFDEPQRRSLTEAIEANPVRLVSAATLLETALVVEARRGEPAGRELDLLLHRATVDTVAVTADQVEIARRAWRRYGKGKHPAGLNFGDCFAYALAASSGGAAAVRRRRLRENRYPSRRVGALERRACPGGERDSSPTPAWRSGR